MDNRLSWVRALSESLSRWDTQGDEVVTNFTPLATDTCLRVRSRTVGLPREYVPRAHIYAVMTVLCQVDDYFTSRLRRVLDMIQPR